MKEELSKEDYIESLINELADLDNLDLCNVITKAVCKKDEPIVNNLLAEEALEYWVEYRDLIDAIVSYSGYIEDIADKANPSEIADLITFDNCHKIAYHLGYNSLKEEEAIGLYEELGYILDKRNSI